MSVLLQYPVQKGPLEQRYIPAEELDGVEYLPKIACRKDGKTGISTSPLVRLS